MKTLITGGCGFIGSNVIRYFIENTKDTILNLDKLTYAGNKISVAELEKHPRYHFIQEDIVNTSQIQDILLNFKPDRIFHLAAESHVDRSIHGPGRFIETNIVGTFSLLQASINYYKNSPTSSKDRFRFIHISTDEVYGALGPDGVFTEQSPYAPNSPYSASKAASDHLVRAWGKTYGLPVILTNCSNNYGPFQLPEKLIPVIITKALAGHLIPIFGDGQQIRDWIHVNDHAEALRLIADKGTIGDSYLIGGNCEIKNIELAKKICMILDELQPRSDNQTYSQQLNFVEDRPGHDFRYSVDSSKLQTELGWKPTHDIESGLKDTVQWYLGASRWISQLKKV